MNTTMQKSAALAELDELVSKWPLPADYMRQIEVLNRNIAESRQRNPVYMANIANRRMAVGR